MIRMAVFMSHGTSLADWDRQGILDREVAIYRKLVQSGAVEACVLVSPGRVVSPYAERVKPLQILGSYTQVPMFCHSILTPFLHWRALRMCNIFRGHNGRALWGPLIARWLYGGHLIVRFGYVWSLDMVYRGVSGAKLWCVLFWEWMACRWADAILVSHERQAQYLRDVHGVA